jgi:hypothetical protein
VHREQFEQRRRVVTLPLPGGGGVGLQSSRCMMQGVGLTVES